MQSKDLWVETKFVKTAHGYTASPDLNQVAMGSRLIATIQAKTYNQMISRYAQGFLLDLGCGHVPLYGMYRERIIDNICVDWQNTLHKNPYLDYEMDLNQPISFKSETFDTILITDVLEHLAKPELLFSEMARLLKPGGKILLTVPFFYWIHEYPHDYFRYTESALKMFCENHNLTIVELQPYGGAPEIILDIISKNIIKFPFLVSLCVAIGKLFVDFPPGIKLSIKTAKHFPLGYCLVAQKPAL